MNQPTLSGTMVVPIISEFERDDLLRLTSVRHWRDEFQLGAGKTRLLGRYDYAYDQNSMMLYEGRWHERISMPASTEQAPRPTRRTSISTRATTRVEGDL